MTQAILDRHFARRFWGLGTLGVFLSIRLCRIPDGIARRARYGGFSNYEHVGQVKRS